jgi:hypothetical protein
MLRCTESMFVPRHPCVICGKFTHDTGICPTQDEVGVCIYCRLEGHDLRVCPTLNGYCWGCEIPGHQVHHHDAPLNIYEALETFKVLKKFGLHSCRLAGTPELDGTLTTIKVMKNQDTGAWRMKWTTQGEVFEVLGPAPGIAPGHPQV